MQRVHDFLKEAKIYYLATVDGTSPKNRPFGTINIFENRLYIQTGRRKPVYRQLKANPKAEICACINGRWLRVSGNLIEDTRIEAEKDMLSKYPELQHMYQPGDGNNCVFYFENAEAVFSSFTEENEIIKF